MEPPTFQRLDNPPYHLSPQPNLPTSKTSDVVKCEVMHLQTDTTNREELNKPVLFLMSQYENNIYVITCLHLNENANNCM